MGNDFPKLTDKQIKLYERARGLYEEMNDLAAARLAKEKAYADFVGEELDFHDQALKYKDKLLDKIRASTAEMMQTNAQIEKSISQEQELLIATEKRLAKLKVAALQAGEEQEDRDEAIKKQEEMIENLKAQTDRQKHLLELGEEGRNAKIEENKTAHYILNTEKKSIKARKSIVGSIQSGVEGMFGMSKASESVNLKLALIYASGQSLTDIIKEAAAEMFTMEFAARMMQAASEKIGEALTAGFFKVWDILAALDGLSVEFSKATGEARDYKQTIADLQQTNSKYGATQEEVAGNLTALRQNFTSATKVSAETEKQLASLMIVMDRNGMSAGTTTEALETFNTGLGMSVAESQAAVKDLGHLAKKLGMIPDQLGKSFSASMKELGKYGKNAPKEFAKVAAAAKATGISIEELMSITKKLDTFQGAADAAGNLNAMLGTTINSTDLLLASEGDRIKMLKDSVSMSGRSWSSMNKFEKQAIAAAAGIDDMTTANRLFGGSAAEYEKYQEEQRKAGEEQANLEEQAKKNTQTAAKLGAAVQQLSAAFAPLIDHARAVASWFAENTWAGTTLLYTLLPLYAATKAMAFALQVKSVWSKAAAAGSFLSGIRDKFASIWARIKGSSDIFAGIQSRIRAGWEKFKAMWTNRGKVADTAAAAAARTKAAADAASGKAALKSGTKTAAGTSKAGKAAARSAPQMLALGAAVLMIAIGIAIVVLSLAVLANQMKEMSGGQMLAFAVVVLAIGAALYFAIPAILGAGGGAAAAAPGMAAFGVALITVAFGVAIIALSMALLVLSIVLLVVAFIELIAVMAQNAPQLTMLLGAMALLGMTGMFAAISIGAIALAFGGLALALAFIKTADLQAMGDIFSGIGNIGGDTASALSDVGSAIKEFAGLADDIDFDKMIGIEWFVSGLAGVNAIDPEKLKATSEVIASAATIKPGAGAALQEIAGGFLELTLGSLFITESKLDKIADVIRAATGQSGGGGGGGAAAAEGGSDVVLVLNERELGRAIDVHMENKLSFTKVQSS